MVDLSAPSAPLNVGNFMMPPYKTWTLVDWQEPRYPRGIIHSYTVLYTDDVDETNENNMEKIVTEGK